jgi:hypothetical protein
MVSLPQAAKEHESEKDLFKRLLLGRPGGAVQDSGRGGTPLGLFESGGDDEDGS